jgi:hypothetical protein
MASYLYKADGNAINETLVNLAGTGDQIRNAYVTANGLLDEGDEAHGIDIFPRNTRVAVIKTSFAPVLKTNGVLSLGGANEAYAILKAAGVTGDGERIEDDGYVGTIDGVDTRVISNESLKHASLFCGFPKYEFKNSNLLGYIASSYANARGVSTSKQTDVVKEVNGQGIRLLPYVKFGYACWYPMGNSFLVAGTTDADKLNVFGALKTLFSGVATQLTFKLKSAGSRLFPVFSAFAPTATGVTGFFAQALDDWNYDHYKAAYYVVTTTPVTTVAGFLKAVGSATYKGAATIGTSESGTISTTVGNGEYLSVLAIADDGSCSLISKQYNA